MKEASRTRKENIINPYKIVEGEFEVKREFRRVAVDRSKITKFIPMGYEGVNLSYLFQNRAL
jgi:hypothetical protein